MIAVLKNTATKEQVKNLVQWFEGKGLKVNESQGDYCTVLGLIGDTTQLDIEMLKGLDIIVNGSREDIMSMIHLIKCHAKKLSGEGKHLNAQDERALNDAKVRMNNEIALALDIEPENVIELIHEKTGEVDFA